MVTREFSSTECVGAHLANPEQVKKFLAFCASEGRLQNLGDAEVKNHTKVMATSASGLSVRQNLANECHVTVATFPSIPLLEVYATLADDGEIERFREIAKRGTQEFFCQELGR